jgi:transcriptional/translational regulatory protein YebC/TACO1
VKRTGPKVRNIFSGGRKDNSHGELQKTGVHDFLFRNCASVSYRWPTPEDEDYEAVTSSDLEEQIMDAALESGADDVEFGEDGRGEAVCAVEDARKVQEAIRGAIGGEGEEGEVDLEIGCVAGPKGHQGCGRSGLQGEAREIGGGVRRASATKESSSAAEAGC